jgi:hypothetical protein
MPILMIDESFGLGDRRVDAMKIGSWLEFSLQAVPCSMIAPPAVKFGESRRSEPPRLVLNRSWHVKRCRDFLACLPSSPHFPQNLL